MWTTISRFELRYQLRQPLFALSVALFFALGLALASSDFGTSVGQSPGTSLRNAPVSIVRWMPMLSLLGLFVITAFVANSALRDHDRRCEMLFFTKPLRRADYLGGRFVGSMLVSLLVLLAAVVGLIAGAFAPWQAADRLGPFTVTPYVFGVGVILIPNLLIMGGLFFALATWSRRLSLTFLGVVFFIGMQDGLEIAAEHLPNPLWGALLEPSGWVAFENAIRYWTIAEQNTALPAVGGALLANRAVWMLVAGVALTVTVARAAASPRTVSRSKTRRRTENATTTEAPTAPIAGLDAVALATVRRRFGGVATLRHLVRQTRIELSEVVASTPFLTLLAFGMLVTTVFAFVVGMHDGMPSHPLTHLMIQAIQLGARLTLVLILVLYAGELVFSRRALKLSGVYDALPVSNTVLLGAKVLALLGVVGLFLGVAAGSTIAVQLARGFDGVDLGLYARGLGVVALPLVPLILLAVCLQVVTRHKLVGVLLTGLVLLLRLGLPKLGIESNLLLFGGHPPITYSDLNGYGHQAAPFLWHMAYWSLAAGLLWSISLLFWPRGTDRPWRQRLDVARQRADRLLVIGTTLCLLTMVAVGTWIAKDTHAADTSPTRDQIIQRLADYERLYGETRDLPLPRITAVTATVDLYPDERRVTVRGRYALENDGAEPIRKLPITRSPRWVEGVLRVYGGVTIEHLGLPPHRVLIDDEALGFTLVELDEPLAPGASCDLEFTVQVDHRGLVDRRHNDLIIGNGTFFSTRNVFPWIGYAVSNQIQNPVERTARGLPKVDRARQWDDPAGRARNYLDADWIDLDLTLSTAADQVAIAPGDLVEQRVDGDRAVFRYVTSTPIIDLVPIVSGRWAVARDRWQGIDIEVLHHPDHAFNIERFVEVTKHSLAYMTERFGPYPHGQLRIVEVPSYHDKVAFSFAQLIAYSESWAFSADLDGADLDWLAAVLAHEVAHQWWNHQLVPADVQGATWIAESLPQYAAMKILEAMDGPASVRHFLRFHLDRYLERRGHERIGEQPLSRVENQAYIHYSKASLALYELDARVGQQTVDRALRAFFDQHAFQGPPYPTSEDLLGHLRDAIPSSEHGLIEDLFETVTLYDHRLVDATATERPDGTFLVTLATTSTKWRDDGQGNLTDIPLDDRVELGIFGEIDGEETVLWRESRFLQSPQGRFTIVVDQRPTRAGIDPFHLQIDRRAADNIRPITHR